MRNPHKTWLFWQLSHFPIFGRGPSAWALNSRQWQLAAARAHQENSARARRGRVTLSALPWRAPPPKGEARLGFLQASGELPTWLPLWGSWHGVAVTERASSRDAVAARRLRGQPASAPHSSVSPRRRLYQRAAHALGGVTGKLGAKISAAPGGTEDPRRGSST